MPRGRTARPRTPFATGGCPCGGRCARPSGAMLDAGQRNHGQPRQVQVAHRARRHLRQARPAQIYPSVPGQRDRKPSAADVPTASWIFDVAPGHERHRNEGAARAHQRRRGRRSAPPTPKVPRRARHGAGGLGLAVQEHLRGREGRRRSRTATLRTLTGKRHGRVARRPAMPTRMPGASTPHDRPQHGAAPVVRAHATTAR